MRRAALATMGALCLSLLGDCPARKTAVSPPPSRHLQGTAQVSLKTSAPSVCAGSPQPETCTDSSNATLGIGPVTFYCVANYVENAGNSGNTSADESAQQNVSLGMPAGLAVSWQ
jgi:hypothetical protein